VRACYCCRIYKSTKVLSRTGPTNRLVAELGRQSAAQFELVEAGVLTLQAAKTEREKVAAKRSLHGREQAYAETARTITRALMEALGEKEVQQRDPRIPQELVQRLDDALLEFGALTAATNRNMIWTGQAQQARSAQGFWVKHAYDIMKGLKAAIDRHENCGSYMQAPVDELRREHRTSKQDNVDTKKEIARQWYAQFELNDATGSEHRHFGKRRCDSPAATRNTKEIHGSRPAPQWRYGGERRSGRQDGRADGAGDALLFYRSAPTPVSTQGRS
jgi:hypothetical protein